MFNIIEKNIFCKMDEDGRSKWKDIKKDFFKLLPYYGCNLNSFHEKYPLLKQRWNRIENNHFLEKDMFDFKQDVIFLYKLIENKKRNCFKNIIQDIKDNPKNVSKNALIDYLPKIYFETISSIRKYRNELFLTLNLER
tara:strand:- start:6103 stop:6516 length:414 start_codon:yes stop_codon:yes gene_type:complete